jgi:hypothetical protein
MTPADNKQLYALLNKTGLTADKANLVAGFTEGRSESTKDLTYFEARAMIRWLQVKAELHEDGSHKMRRKIISMAHEMHWHLSGTQKVDMKRLNDWCKTYGYLAKELNKYSYKELPMLVSQFKIVYDKFLKKL